MPIMPKTKAAWTFVAQQQGIFEKLKFEKLLGSIHIGCQIFWGTFDLPTYTNQMFYYLKFVFSKKATKIDEIFTVDLTVCSKCQIDGEDFLKFCGLLGKYEL